MSAGRSSLILILFIINAVAINSANVLGETSVINYANYSLGLRDRLKKIDINKFGHVVNGELQWHEDACHKTRKIKWFLK